MKLRDYIRHTTGGNFGPRKTERNNIKPPRKDRLTAVHGTEFYKRLDETFNIKSL